MHLGNGAITPECGLVALGVAAVASGIAFASARAAGVDRAQARTAGALGAVVFAAQLFNVQIVPFSSVHLIGGVLLAWTLGPPLGLLTMTGLLALQALLLGDGGVLALGANIVNMGLLPAIAVTVVRRWQTASSAGHAALALGATAFACGVLAAGLVVLEVAVGRSTAQLEGLGSFALAMLGAHVVAGLFEAVTTVAVVGCLGGVQRCSENGVRLSAARAATVVMGSLVVAVLSPPSLGLASAAPDGYEASIAALRESGLALGSIDSAQQLVGFSAVVQQWQETVASSLAAPAGLIVVLATTLAGIAAWGCAWACGRNAWRSIA